MPVTFNDEQNQATVYIDPAFRYDTSPRLLGREQYHKNVDFSGSQTSHSNGKGSRVSTPVSEYKLAYSRSGSPDINEIDSAIDQACYETMAGIYTCACCKCKYYRHVLCVINVALDELFYCYVGLQDDNNITSQTNDLYYLTSQQQQV